MFKIAINFFCVLLICCQHSPTGTNYVDVARVNNVNELTIDLQNKIDTLFVWDYTKLNISINPGDKKLKEIASLLDDSIKLAIDWITENKYSINLDTQEFENGIHRLSIILFVKSGTGSLADNLELEDIIIFKDWVVIIDNTEPIPIEIKKIYGNNGRLTIIWDKYLNLNFQKYIVKKLYLHHGNSTFEIFDQNINTWTDSTYVGGEIRFSVNLVAKNKTINGKIESFTSSFPKILNTEIEEQSINIKWEPCKYYHNFKKYVLISVGQMNATDTLAVLTDVNQSQYKYSNPIFGEFKDLYICVNTFKNHYIFEKIKIGFGTRMAPYLNIKFNPANNSYYSEYYNELIRLSADNLDTLTYSTLNDVGHFSISPNGQYAYCFGNSCLVQYNPISLERKNTFSLSGTLGSNAFAYVLSVLDNNKIFLEWINMPSSSKNAHGLVTITINNSITNSTKIKRGPNRYYSNISENGQYLIADNKLHEIFSSGRIKQVLGAFDFIYFTFLDRGQKFVYTKNNQISVYSTENIELLYSHNFNDKIIFPEIDPATGNLGVISENNSIYYVIDLISGEIIFEQKIETRNHTKCTLQNNKLLSNQGFYINLPIQ